MEGSQRDLTKCSGSGTLASLVVHCEELSAEETTSLVSLLPVNTSLTSLALYGLQAGHDEQLVPDGIRMLTQLTSLRITNSSVDFEAACLVRGVTNVLHSTVSLQHLDLERNNFGPSGATGLAEALSWLASLRGLRLGYNALQDAGGHEIAKAVSRLSSLSELGLESNSFTPAGVSKIAEDLASLPDLVIALQDASLTSDYVDSMPPSRHEQCNVRMTVLPSSIVEAFEPAGVPGMRFKHGIRGNMPHTLAVTFDMKAMDLDSGRPWWRERLWIAWFGALRVGSAHWIMNDRVRPLQFGVCGGGQLNQPAKDCMSALFSGQHLRTIVSVHDGSTYSVFINGNPVGRLEARFSFPDNGQVAVGEDARHDGRLLGGKVYALQVWDVALSEDQVRLVSSAMAARLPH